MELFTDEQKKAARRADLYSFLRRNHPSQVKVEGDSLRLLSNKSVSVKRGYSGFKDFSSGEHGNSIDFLVNYLGYDKRSAVFALCGDSYIAPNPVPVKPDIIVKPTFPAPAEGQYKQLFAFLKSRAISQETIQRLIDEKLLYQSAEHNNVVFINKEQDFAELRGTYTLGEKAFHGVVANCRHDGFWWFKPKEGKADAVYICEAAIDAISLYELDRLDHTEGVFVYVSIAGVQKQPAIDRIKSGIRTIMAVDNDEAGKGCRLRNAELESRIPIKKDWNEDLQERMKGKLSI